METHPLACCFTGHRRLQLQEHALVRYALRQVLETLLHQEVSRFLAGGALGFDTIAAQEVLRLRQAGAPVTLFLVLPCYGQEAKWSPRDVRVYQEILSQADQVQYTAETYTPGCMHKRNRFMVDHSTHCLCYLRGEKGGTAYTVAYAKERGKEMIFLADQVFPQEVHPSAGKETPTLWDSFL